MADEAVPTDLIEISYGIDELTSAEVIHKINECVSLDQQIHLIMSFPGRDYFDDGDDDDENYERLRFDATADMQYAAIQYSMLIKKIAILNNCSEKDEHSRCFNFFTRIVQEIIGNGKYLSYYSCKYEFGINLKQANQLADAVSQLNNNNNIHSITSFDFYEPNLTPVTFQLLWNALLDSGVPEIRFGNGNGSNDWFGDTGYKNITIDFTGMETNTSLKELELGAYKMQEKDYRNLFNSLKVNKGLENLQLNYWTYLYYYPIRMKRLLKEMMCENITLLHCGLSYVDEEDEQDRIFQVIRFHMKLDRMWKRYIMKREEEKKTPVVITKIEDEDNNTNEEEERKKRLKMRLLFHVFYKKPVMRDTILFHLLSEYPDDLIDTDSLIAVTDRDDGRGIDRDDDNISDNYDDTNNIWSESESESESDDSDSESNDGTDDLNDSDGDSDSDDDTNDTL